MIPPLPFSTGLLIVEECEENEPGAEKTRVIICDRIMITYQWTGRPI